MRICDIEFGEVVVSDKTVKSVQCDGCGTEMIEVTNYPARYGLHLTPKDYARHRDGGMVFAVAILPQIDKPLDFCDARCLRSWLDRKFPDPRDSQWI